MSIYLIILLVIALLYGLRGLQLGLEGCILRWISVAFAGLILWQFGPSLVLWAEGVIGGQQMLVTIAIYLLFFLVLDLVTYAVLSPLLSVVLEKGKGRFGGFIANSLIGVAVGLYIVWGVTEAVQLKIIDSESVNVRNEPIQQIADDWVSLTVPETWQKSYRFWLLSLPNTPAPSTTASVEAKEEQPSETKAKQMFQQGKWLWNILKAQQGDKDKEGNNLE